jgi:hypothetical protein
VTLLRRGFAALSTCWLLSLLVPLSSTGLDFPSFLFAFGLTVLFGTLSLVLVLTRRPVNRARVLVWLVHPLAASLVLLLFLSSQSPANPLFRLRFYLIRPALEDATRSALSQQPLVPPAWIGLFPVRRIDVYHPEVRFISDGCGVVDECGLLYMPGPIPGGRYKTRVKHLEGAWYHVYSVF